MKKRVLSTMLALSMVLILMPVTVQAADITYPVTGGNIYFDASTGTITDCDDDVTAAIIPITIYGVPVTSIGRYAFHNCSNLTSVDIPDTVTSIGQGAFERCSSLTSVTIPASVTSIEYGVFAYCNNLTSINVANGNSAYSSVDGILFNADQTLLHTYPAGKSGTTYHVPSSVTTIWLDAFHLCQNLTSVIIPNSVTSIEVGAFIECSNLTSVTIPASVTSIEEAAFYCESLTDVYYGGSRNQWEAIFIGLDNDPLLNSTIHYNSTGYTPSTSNDISVTVGGKAVTWTDAAPYIDTNSRTMVPLRAVADAMGLDVNWNAFTREAAFTNGSKTIYFPIDSNAARTSNGGTVQMDTAAVIVNERTYAPIRYLAEYFGYEVGWDAATRTVIIK